MEIYLIRHTTPAISAGICYGQSDIDVADSFLREAMEIKTLLPLTVNMVYSSPLKRCKKLAEFLFPDKEINYADELMEIDCGKWELKNWNDINREELDFWMSDFVNSSFPGGESFTDVIGRAQRLLQRIKQSSGPAVVLVTHAGFIRSMLSLMYGVSPQETFKRSISYGDVIQLTAENSD